MTVWEARKAKRGDILRLLCGRMVEGEYACPAPVAHLALFSSDGQPAAKDEVWLPVGLTDDGSPGEYRWTKDALRRRQRHQSRLRRRDGAQILSVRLGSATITVPCTENHQNAISRDDLGR